MTDESYQHEHRFIRSTEGFSCITCHAHPSEQNMRQNVDGTWSYAQPILVWPNTWAQRFLSRLKGWNGVGR